jgi:transcriptional regulator with XRE-family HTH domain
MNELLVRLTEEFGDADYAHAYIESHAVSRLAAQIYALRKQRSWSQADLADRAGIAQERVSKIENADFDSLTMKTLNKFSQAFDVALNIHFESFSQAIVDVVHLNQESLKVKSRLDDLLEFKNLQNGKWILATPSTKAVVTAMAPKSFNSVSPPLNQWQTLGLEKVAA